MATHYITEEEKTRQYLPNCISKKSGGYVLCNFSHAGDLLFGIDALKSFNIPIHEVYSPSGIKALKSRLEIKRLRAGYHLLKYGCLGGTFFISVVSYALTYDWPARLSIKDMILPACTAFFLISVLVFATRLLAVKPPQIVKLPENDQRFLIVVKTTNIMHSERVANFLQYSGSVEITQAVKRMLLV